jgi:hypothetical protein
MITPRPWLEVIDEAFPALEESKPSQEDQVYHIVIDRYHPDYEDY